MILPPISNAADQSVPCIVSVYYCSEICSTFQIHMLSVSGFHIKKVPFNRSESDMDSSILQFKHFLPQLLLISKSDWLIVIRVQTTLLASVSRTCNVFFQLAIWKKNIFFDVDKCGLAFYVLLSTTIRVITVVKICCGLTRRNNTVFSS